MKKHRKWKEPKTGLLVDTSVWLDLAKDYRNLSIISALEDLVHLKKIEILAPQIVLDEFARNKDRIAEESGKSLSGVLKRVKQAIDQYGEDRAKALAVEALNDIDHRIATTGDSVNFQVERIEALLKTSRVIPTSDAIKLRAAQRAIDKRAPFHRQRNGIDDALIIEIFADLVAGLGQHLVFATHNHKDFSDTDHRKPHPDIAGLFASAEYSINLAETLNAIAPDVVEDCKFEAEFVEESRRLTAILAAIEELTDKIWYDRHSSRAHLIAEGKIKIVGKEDVDRGASGEQIQQYIWDGALAAAKEVERRYGIESLGPHTDFEWGMLSGKLSALRWVLGDEWDMLDT